MISAKRGGWALSLLWGAVAAEKCTVSLPKLKNHLENLSEGPRVEVHQGVANAVVQYFSATTHFLMKWPPKALQSLEEILEGWPMSEIFENKSVADVKRAVCEEKPTDADVQQDPPNPAVHEIRPPTEKEDGKKLEYIYPDLHELHLEKGPWQKTFEIVAGLQSECAVPTFECLAFLTEERLDKAVIKKKSSLVQTYYQRILDYVSLSADEMKARAGKIEELAKRVSGLSSRLMNGDIDYTEYNLSLNNVLVLLRFSTSDDFLKKRAASIESLKKANGLAVKKGNGFLDGGVEEPNLLEAGGNFEKLKEDLDALEKEVEEALKMNRNMFDAKTVRSTAYLELVSFAIDAEDSAEVPEDQDLDQLVPYFKKLNEIVEEGRRKTSRQSTTNNKSKNKKSVVNKKKLKAKNRLRKKKQNK